MFPTLCNAHNIKELHYGNSLRTVPSRQAAIHSLPAIGISLDQNEPETCDCFHFVQVSFNRSRKNGKKLFLVLIATYRKLGPYSPNILPLVLNGYSKKPIMPE